MKQGHEFFCQKINITECYWFLGKNTLYLSVGTLVFDHHSNGIMWMFKERMSHDFIEELENVEVFKLEAISILAIQSQGHLLK